MSIQTQLYLFTPRHQCILLELKSSSASNRRYQAVYTKHITINRGIPNQIEFHFINQEQKNVNLLNKTLTWRLMSSDGTRLLATKDLTPVYAATGLMKLSLTQQESEMLDSGLTHYSIVLSTATDTNPAYVTQNNLARGVCEILDSVFPERTESTQLNIVSHHPVKPKEPVRWVSSVFETNGRNITTFQLWMNRFTGTITLESSDLYDFGRVYPITNHVYQYENKSGTMAINVSGYYPYLRLSVNNTGTVELDNITVVGDVTKILVR